ncbi:hypothetical protein [Streptomyces clavifer]|uniref:hypothetical protein n=1 Tax=Streptomyces clavifer TaxID=68188 RepID=UPI0036A015FD
MAASVLTRRERVETAAVCVLAVLVHGAAVVSVVVAGPWTLVPFVPALIGSLVAVRLVRRAIVEARAGTAGRESAGPERSGTEPDGPGRRAAETGDNRAHDQGAGG